MSMLFGISGFPLSIPEKGNVFDALKLISNLGLDGMELAFVRSVWLTEKKAPEVDKIARKLGIFLSAHAQYYINLNAKEYEKVEASYKRLLKASKIAALSGAENVIYHAGFYLGKDKKSVLEIMRDRIRYINNMLEESNLKIKLRPETTGKGSQFGSLEELLDISLSEKIQPCIDFAHIHARSGGKFNSKAEFEGIINMIEHKLGKKALSDLHLHVSGIEYSQKGEIRHLPLEESDFKYKELLQVLKENGCSGRIICESPILEKDALLMKKYYEKI